MILRYPHATLGKCMLGVILTENSFEFNGQNYLQTHGVAMGTKTAVSFANIFMAEIETNLIQQNDTKPREWKRYIDDVYSLWDCNKNEVDRFIQQANAFHPTIKFTAEISENEITFLDTVVFKGERFTEKSILDIKTHYKPSASVDNTLLELQNSSYPTRSHNRGWRYGTIFLFLEQIAPSSVAHARTCCEKMTSVITELKCLILLAHNTLTTAHKLNTYMSVGIWLLSLTKLCSAASITTESSTLLHFKFHIC